MMGDTRASDTTNDDLSLEVAKLSAAAYAMAQIATERGDFAAHEAAARALDERLTALWPRIETADPAEQPALEQSWTDARLDLGYVLSAGELPMSTRLNTYFQDGTEIQ